MPTNSVTKILICHDFFHKYIIVSNTIILKKNGTTKNYRYFDKILEHFGTLNSPFVDVNLY